MGIVLSKNELKASIYTTEIELSKAKKAINFETFELLAILLCPEIDSITSKGNIDLRELSP